MLGTWPFRTRTLEKSSVVNPDPDPNFHVEADPDPDPGWHQNNADPHADPTSSITHVVKAKKFFTFCHRIAILQCFIFLISVRCVVCFQYFGKVYFINFFICLELIPNRFGLIRIGMPWMSIPIRIQIRQNDADPTRSRSGSTTLEKGR
jgi:hypothetical protein